MWLIESRINCQRLVCLARLGERTSTGEGRGGGKGVELHGELYPSVTVNGRIARPGQCVNVKVLI